MKQFSTINNSLKICLLGGSNSLVSHGLMRGISSCAQLLNLAVGATSSLQNIFAMVRRKPEIETGIDAIVTESNVNDGHAVLIAKVPMSVVKANIEKMYRELALTGKPIVAVLLPVRRYEEHVMAESVFEELKQYHLQCATAYGCAIIDVDAALAKYTLKHPDVKKIIQDPHHVLDSYMYELGRNITRYLEDTTTRTNGVDSFMSNFEVIQASQLSDNLVAKKNSLMGETVFAVERKLNVKIDSGTLVGIASWSDGPSEMKITGNGQKTIKQFNSLVAFNEILLPYRGNVSLQSIIGKTRGITERSINCPNAGRLEHPVNLIGLLVEKDETVQSAQRHNGFELHELLPDETVYIKSIERYLVQNRLVESTTMPKHQVNSLRDAALKLEKDNLKLAFELMKIANQQGSGGVSIRQKFISYRDELLRLKMK